MNKSAAKVGDDLDARIGRARAALATISYSTFCNSAL